jgi:hypothetical protein
VLYPSAGGGLGAAPPGRRLAAAARGEGIAEEPALAYAFGARAGMITGWKWTGTERPHVIHKTMDRSGLLFFDAFCVLWLVALLARTVRLSSSRSAFLALVGAGAMGNYGLGRLRPAAVSLLGSPVVRTTWSGTLSGTSGICIRGRARLAGRDGGGWRVVTLVGVNYARYSARKTSLRKGVSL